MPFSREIKIEAMVACGRHCSICHKFCGTKIESHHIVHENEGGASTLDNCIPVCFDCHADMTSYDAKHPRGTKYQAAELIAHRDRWFQKVEAGGGLNALIEHIDVDRQVFSAFERSIPYSPTVRSLAEHDFGSPFMHETFEPLEVYLNESDRVHFEFLDPTLEAARGAFVAALKVLYGAMKPNIFPASLPGHYAIPIEWRQSREARYDDARDAIHKAATECLTSYNALVRTVRQRLGVSGELRSARDEA